ncbi:hypothetical protein CDD81_1334 [Ophiocordyceps australis]|uniref:PNK FHA domain-containing protein n=1 Tax=Ophiocordyceps australis TaxID=1399860 RepID=A0A2C5XZ67_9HYPO|nr:hypothetical protein CDD81_1334 [Ophiocordyceps australis]
MTPNATGKRKAVDSPNPPPSIKRSLQSTVTKSAVANFFTPASQKPKDRTTWSQRRLSLDAPTTLLVGCHVPLGHDEQAAPRCKLAAFDLDSTLITTASGKKHASNAGDWKWWDSSVPGKLRELHHKQGYQVVILSNQGGLTLHFNSAFKGPKASAQKRVSDFKQKCTAILSSLDLPTSIYAATANDMYRKPRDGMWREACKDYGMSESTLDIANSFFVGDAGGRTAVASTCPDGNGSATSATKDFSCSDRNLAHNLGITYQTPEEYFLDEKPRDFCHGLDFAAYPYKGDGHFEQVDFEKKDDCDVILFCGPPAAGKSTFFWRHLEPLGYERVNQDLLKSREKCLQVAKELLASKKSIAIDNTNADVETRALWVGLAKKNKVPIRCLWFRTPLHLCEHNDAVRALNQTLNPEARPGLPKLAFTSFASRYKVPTSAEGFEDVVPIEFTFGGSRQDHQIWARYWL